MNKNEPQTQQVDRLLTKVEMAKLLNVNLVTIYRYTKSGKIPFFRVGRRLLFDKELVLTSIKADCHAR
jgi:excisionase family DNA binding protein